MKSSEHMRVNFNPASLLSFGDALAWAGQLSGGKDTPLFPAKPSMTSLTDAMVGNNSTLLHLAAPEEAPAMAEQIAPKGIMSRVPQKYLIQNESGLKVYYWAGPVRRPSRCMGMDLRISSFAKIPFLPFCRVFPFCRDSLDICIPPQTSSTEFRIR